MDWRNFPCTSKDPTAWIEGRTSCSTRPASTCADNLSTQQASAKARRRRGTLFALFASGGSVNGAQRDKSKGSSGSSETGISSSSGISLLEARMNNLLGFSEGCSLHRPPDCRVVRFRPGERIYSHEEPGAGIPLVLVLEGVAVVKVGGRVVDWVWPGGCIGGAQFILQVLVPVFYVFFMSFINKVCLTYNFLIHPINLTYIPQWLWRPVCGA